MIPFRNIVVSEIEYFFSRPTVVWEPLLRVFLTAGIVYVRLKVRRCNIELTNLFENAIIWYYRINFNKTEIIKFNNNNNKKKNIRIRWTNLPRKPLILPYWSRNVDLPDWSIHRTPRVRASPTNSWQRFHSINLSRFSRKKETSILHGNKLQYKLIGQSNEKKIKNCVKDCIKNSTQFLAGRNLCWRQKIQRQALSEGSKREQPFLHDFSPQSLQRTPRPR